MVAESLRDIPSDESLSGDEDDPTLLVSCILCYFNGIISSAVIGLCSCLLQYSNHFYLTAYSVFINDWIQFISTHRKNSVQAVPVIHGPALHDFAFMRFKKKKTT